MDDPAVWGSFDNRQLLHKLSCCHQSTRHSNMGWVASTFYSMTIDYSYKLGYLISTVQQKFPALMLEIG
jgi:hypothetical protein